MCGTRGDLRTERVMGLPLFSSVTGVARWRPVRARERSTLILPWNQGCDLRRLLRVPAPYGTALPALGMLRNMAATAAMTIHRTMPMMMTTAE